MVGQTVSIKTSFIIPHKGREEMLVDTIQSIANLDTPKTEFEVIIVSQNDSVSELIQSYNKTLNLSVIYNNEERTISHSRNTGAKQAKGEYLAFLDADVALANSWLNTMIEIITSRPNTVLVSAMQVNSQNATPLEKIRTALSNAELDTEVNFLPGRNLFIRKETFEDAGRFPEHLLTCEDYYFTDKVNEIGGLYYTSQTQYVHIGEDKAFLPMYKKEIWRGQSNLASLKGRKIPLRELPSFFVPFAVTGGVISALIGMALNNHLISAIFFMLALIPFGAYTLRLKKLTKSTVSLYHCIMFYALYFPARALGTLLGVRGAVTTSSHR